MIKAITKAFMMLADEGLSVDDVALKPEQYDKLLEEMTGQRVYDLTLPVGTTGPAQARPAAQGCISIQISAPWGYVAVHRGNT